MSMTTQQAQGQCPAYHGYEPFDMTDPFGAYAELRAEEPVMFDDRIGYWVVTRYDDIKGVFEDWETFSSENAQAPVRERSELTKQIMAEGGFTAYSGLSARIPPDHTRSAPSRPGATRRWNPRSGPMWCDSPRPCSTQVPPATS